MSKSHRNIQQPEPKMHWILDIFQRKFPAVKNFLIHIACFAAGCILILFLYEKFIIPGKDATLAQKDETIRTVSSERDSIKREFDRLSTENEQLRAYRGKDAPPLKQDALILAHQIHDYIKDWKDTDPPDQQYHNVQKYVERFGTRASLMRDDLDQNGKDSPEFDKVMFNFYNNYNYKGVQTIADEIEKLANNLPD
jgi:hypothetical protein